MCVVNLWTTSQPQPWAPEYWGFQHVPLYPSQHAVPRTLRILGKHFWATSPTSLHTLYNVDISASSRELPVLLIYNNDFFQFTLPRAIRGLLSVAAMMDSYGQALVQALLLPPSSHCCRQAGLEPFEVLGLHALTTLPGFKKAVCERWRWKLCHTYCVSKREDLSCWVTRDVLSNMLKRIASLSCRFQHQP